MGQMTYGVYVVACESDGMVRAYTSTWTYQMSFEGPVLAISISPKHDSYPPIMEQGWFSVSILAGDQIEPAQLSRADSANLSSPTRHARVGRSPTPRPVSLNAGFEEHPGRSLLRCGTIPV